MYMDHACKKSVHSSYIVHMIIYMYHAYLPVALRYHLYFVDIHLDQCIFISDKYLTFDLSTWCTGKNL